MTSLPRGLAWYSDSCCSCISIKGSSGSCLRVLDSVVLDISVYLSYLLVYTYDRLIASIFWQLGCSLAFPFSLRSGFGTDKISFPLIEE